MKWRYLVLMMLNKYEEWWRKKYASKLVRARYASKYGERVVYHVTAIIGPAHLDTCFLRLWRKTTDHGYWYGTNYCQSCLCIRCFLYWLSHRARRWWLLQCLHSPRQDGRDTVEDPRRRRHYSQLSTLTPRNLASSYLRREELPAIGFCVAVGIPSTKKDVEIINGLHGAGPKCASFKSGFVEGIRQVISISAANPNLPTILQWTGSRAGGHHSYEDF